MILIWSIISSNTVYTLDRVYRMQRRISLGYTRHRLLCSMLWVSMVFRIMLLRSFLRNLPKKYTSLRPNLKLKVYRNFRLWVSLKTSFQVHWKQMGWSILVNLLVQTKPTSKGSSSQSFMAITFTKQTQFQLSINYYLYTVIKIPRSVKV